MLFRIDDWARSRVIIIRVASGNVVKRDGYEAGQAAFPQRGDDRSGGLTSQTTRGVTGQRELADVGLVHLNGLRTADLAMVSAGPFVPTTKERPLDR